MNPEQSTATLVRVLGAAGEHHANGNSDAHHDAIGTAAQVLANLYASTPTVLPSVLEALRLASPAVRPADLTAATAWATDAVSDATGERPAVLHPECPTWIAIACTNHPGSDPTRVTAALSVNLSRKGEVSRPDPLPLSDDLGELVNDCTAPDILAMADVMELHIDATRELVARTGELLALIEAAMTSEGMTVLEAVDTLTGPDRIRAEELVAAMPSLVGSR